MKKIFLTTAAAFYLIFGFFITQLNAQAGPVFTSSTGQKAVVGLPLDQGAEPNISMDFKDASLKDILKALSMQAGMNFIASEAVQDRKVTLYFDKVPLGQVIDKIFSANNLSYELDSKANIFVVKEWGKMEAQTITKVFYLKNATVSTSSLKADLSSKPAIGSAAVVSSTGGKWLVDGESGVTSAVRKLLSSSGSVMEDFRTNSLIVTDTPMRIQIISQVITSLDIPVTQVMLEVEMLDVSKDVVDKIGFEFGDSPFTAILTGATAATGFPFSQWTPALLTKGSLAINSGTNTYQMQLDFMRTHTDTKFLARPKLLTLNNETAEISITKDEIVGREDTVESNSGVTTTTYKFIRATELKLTPEGTGIFLRVTPQVNLDTGEITMVVNPKSSVTNISDLSVETSQQADIEVRSTRSIVKVKDGETVVLGGLIHHDKKVILKKLPILGDLPFVGMFFRHKDQTDGLEREMIVFITPHIIKDTTDISKLDQVKNIQLPVREQGVTVNTARDYIINSNMNKFEKNINGKR